MFTIIFFTFCNLCSLCSTNDTDKFITNKVGSDINKTNKQNGCLKCRQTKWPCRMQPPYLMCWRVRCLTDQRGRHGNVRVLMLLCDNPLTRWRCGDPVPLRLGRFIVHRCDCLRVGLRVRLAFLLCTTTLPRCRCQTPWECVRHRQTQQEVKRSCGQSQWLNRASLHTLVQSDSDIPQEPRVKCQRYLCSQTINQNIPTQYKIRGHC